MSWRCVSGCACVGGRVVHVEAGRREEGGRGGRREEEEEEGHEIGRADVGKVQGEVNEATAGRKGNGNGRNEQERRKEAWKEGRVGVGVGVEGACGNRRKKKQRQD